MNYNGEFRLTPPQASSMADRVDGLFTYLVAVGGFFVLIIFLFIVYFALKYHYLRVVNRTVSYNPRGLLSLEIFWSMVPLVLVMIMFGWGASLYFEQFTPPRNAIEINVVGKQWMWKLQHPDGRREINELHVPLGQPVRLRMISEDVIHSFYVPAFRMKMDVLPGRYTSIWFTATREGEYHLFCAEYCGTNHSKMRGRVVVMRPSQYAAWVQEASVTSMIERGRALFEQFRCVTCHEGPTQRGPSLAGIFGRREPLEDGGSVIVNDNYLRESIVDPQAKIVAGYPRIMPSFRGQIGEEGILQIIDYIKSLSNDEARTR